MIDNKARNLTKIKILRNKILLKDEILQYSLKTQIMIKEVIKYQTNK